MATKKQELYGLFSRIGAAFAHPARLELIEMLSQGEKPVELLAQRAGLTVKNTSAHLRLLREAALVETRREGTRIFYRLADHSVEELLDLVRRVATQRLATVRELTARHFAGAHDLTPVDRDGLAARVERGDVTLIDVRPADEYAQGHIAGAVSVPLAELDAHLATLPRDRDVVAYCRGEYCLMSRQAADRLRARGFRASSYPGSVAAWRRAGGPVLSSPME